MAHISEETLQAYVGNRLPVPQEREVMEHIARCDSCAARFAGMMTDDKMVSPPPDLKKDILNQTVYRRNPVQVMRGLQERKRERQREFLAYSARVVFAMTASVLIVVTMSAEIGSWQREPSVKLVQMQKQEAPKPERKNQLSASLQKASGKMGDALNGVLTMFDKQEEEERE